MEAANNEKKIYQQNTDSFSLTLQLSENKLILNLKDFMDWIIYVGDFTKQNIGKDIHQKMDLNDIYSAFRSQSLQSDAERRELEQNGIKIFNHYVFGSAKMRQGLPCYKIEKEGKITAYLNLIDSRTKKQILYESQLKLRKLRQMTSLEISSLKTAFDKNSIYKNLTNKANKQKQQLLKDIEKLRLKNKNLKMRYLNFPQPKNMIYFKISGLSLIYTDSSGLWTHFIFNDPIYSTQIAKFKIKITKSRRGQIILGIVDYEKQKDERCSHYTFFAMCYVGNNAKKRPECVIEGSGFKQGDIVEVEVNRNASTVKYFVNGTLQAAQKNAILTEKFRVFMPYVEMIEIGDTVEYLAE